MPYADLELSLHRRDADAYAIEMRFTQPDSDADVRLISDAALVRFDTAQLRALSADAVAYGQALSASLFAEQAVATAFAQARASAQSLNVPLRLRLFIGPSAPE